MYAIGPFIQLNVLYSEKIEKKVFTKEFGDNRHLLYKDLPAFTKHEA